jgi:hypothetical protein
MYDDNEDSGNDSYHTPGCSNPIDEDGSQVAAMDSQYSV